MTTVVIIISIWLSIAASFHLRAWFLNRETEKLKKLNKQLEDQPENTFFGINSEVIN